MSTQMSAVDAQSAFADLSKKIGSKAEVSVFLSRGEKEQPLWCMIRPRGYSASDERYLTVEGASFEDLFAKAEAAWAEQREGIRADTIAKMALAIIRLTDSVGECSEAMLRLEFDRSHVSEWGAEAVERANEMAARGPFSIKATLGANRPLEDA